MKHLILLSCVMLSGCGMRTSDNFVVFGEVTDDRGKDRLVLKFVESQLPRAYSGRGYDFHSLVWETKKGAAWTAKVTVTQGDFQRDTKRRRWISEIHSLEPETGHAVFKVGEEDAPDASGAIRVIYSWREWDLVADEEVRTLRVCDSPFDPLDESNGRQGN